MSRIEELREKIKATTKRVDKTHDFLRCCTNDYARNKKYKELQAEKELLEMQRSELIKLSVEA